MGVESVRKELTDRLPDYELIRDIIAGSRQVKAKREKYLPNPDPLDTSRAGQLRYADYLARAVFYPATGRTLRGLVGMVFDKDPAIERPDRLLPVVMDAAGDGIHIDQQAKKTLYDVVSIGRRGVFTDYPETNGPTTVADANAGNVRPTIITIEAENIINWRFESFGSRKLLTLVVIRETYTKSDDGFVEEPGTRYRVLRLTKGANGARVYTVELWEDAESRPTRSFTPVDGAGKAWDEIPFEFVGALNNEPSVDDPPLLDLAELNKHHFLNSADYEESVFLVGQPTPVFAGLTQQWVKDVFREETDDGHGGTKVENKVRLGSRAAVPLPEGGTATLLQAEPNSMAYEAMEHKEKQMIALGAKLIENTGTQQTATEASLDAVLDNSVLATAANNVSTAYRKALQWAWRYISGQVVDDDKVIDYKLNTDFAGKLLSAQDRQQIIQAWTQRAITYTEMRWNMRRTGVAYLTDDEAKEESDAEREASIAFEADAAGALAEATGTPPAKDEPPSKGKPPVKKAK
jgi:hypothetical protein